MMSSHGAALGPVSYQRQVLHIPLHLLSFCPKVNLDNVMSKNLTANTIITERFGLEGTLKDQRVPTPAQAEHLPLDQLD